MFTGIIQAVGKIDSYDRKGDDARLKVSVNDLGMSDTEIGDSIAVQGVCLTVIEMTDHWFTADISGETLSCTTLASLSAGSRVNLEKSVTPTTRLGGHLVSGHVDGVGVVRERVNDGRSVRFQIELPDELGRYIARKGSVCVDGISLTVNEVHGNTFELNIIPHTLAATTLNELEIGNRVNLEVDVVARYIERLMQGGEAANTGRITPELLRSRGYLK